MVVVVAVVVVDGGGTGGLEPWLTLTLYELMTRFAFPVKGSVPDWIDWRYCEDDTPWFAMRYSIDV